MKIIIATLGSRGDVQPGIALSKGLQKAGHDVHLIVDSYFEAFVRDYGIDYSLWQLSFNETLKGEVGQVLMQSAENPVRFVRAYNDLLNLVLRQITLDLQDIVQPADLLLCSPFVYDALRALGEQWSVPIYPVCAQPLTRTRTFSSSVLLSSFNLGGVGNWLTHVLFEQVMWQSLRSTVNNGRQTIWNLPPLPFTGDMRWLYQDQQLVLYAYSSAVVPRPADWCNAKVVTGYWFLDCPSQWHPPADLVDFLQSGPPPVYVGFGSMMDNDVQQTTDIVLQTLTQSRQRGVLAAGWGGLSRRDLPDHVFMIDDVPHDWLFPQMAAVVHHGGAGTTAAGLRAGVPAVIVPFFADQPFWGNRVAALNVGPKPILHRQLSVERLTQAMNEATHNPEMRRRAAALGVAIRAEDGVGTAVNALHQHLQHAQDLAQIGG
jgi:UDP:flavonoid glycosyltransferase YjiC (YdhE family)